MSIQLTKLCHDVVQNSYKDLHALLDSIGDDNIPTRHDRLAEHILLQRHRFARLLVAVRWFMSYSAFHYSAQATRDLGAKRSNVIIHGADTLWAVSGVVRGAVAHPSAIQEAAEVLGSASYMHRIPRCIETGVHVDTFGDAFDTSSEDSLGANVPHLKNPDRMIVEKPDASRDEKAQLESVPHLTPLESEAVDRLRAATYDLVSRALPKGVKLIKLGVEPAGAAVRVGVPGSWTADVVLDRLLVTEAFFVLLNFSIMVDSSPDAVNDIKTPHHASERALILTKEQEEPLREMLEDRMRWVAVNAKADDVVDRAKKVLHCLCEAIRYECCGRLALHHIRSQCRALVSRGIWSSQDFNVTEAGTGRDAMSSIHVRYWQRSSMMDTVEISVSSEPSLANMKADIATVVSVESRALSHSSNGLLNLASLDVERLLLDICRERALDCMNHLIQAYAGILPTSASMKISRSSTSAVSVLLELLGEGPVLIFGMSLRTGGVLVRGCGTLARSSADRSPHVRAVRDLLWDGERFFAKPVPSFSQVLGEIIEKTVAACSHTIPAVNVLHRKGKKVQYTAIPANLHAQSIRHSPANEEKDNISKHPGSSSGAFWNNVAEKKGKEVIDVAHDTSFGTLSGKCVSSQAKSSLCLGHAAVSLAHTDEAAYRQAVEKLRGILTSEMEALKVLTTTSPSSAAGRGGKSQIPVKTTPMDTESSTIHIHGCTGWVLRLVLRRNIFDQVTAGGVISYVRKTRTLRFSYPGISKRTVQCFRKDLIRARTAAALITGLTATPGKFTIRRRRPTHVTVELGDITLSAGLGRRSVELETHPPRSIVATQLIPLIEEMLNDAGMEMGQRFGELLERSLPIGQAIQSILPKDPKKFRIRFLTALRARYAVARLNGRKQMTYAIDIDARAGRDRIMLIDVARAYKVTSNSKSSSAAQQFSPMPMWEAVLSKLETKGKGRPVHERAAVQIPTNLLHAILSVTVGQLR